MLGLGAMAPDGVLQPRAAGPGLPDWVVIRIDVDLARLRRRGRGGLAHCGLNARMCGVRDQNRTE
jgi:hypothetical protein